MKYWTECWAEWLALMLYIWVVSGSAILTDTFVMSLQADNRIVL